MNHSHAMRKSCQGAAEPLHPFIFNNNKQGSPFHLPQISLVFKVVFFCSCCCINLLKEVPYHMISLPEIMSSLGAQQSECDCNNGNDGVEYEAINHHRYHHMDLDQHLFHTSFWPFVFISYLLHSQPPSQPRLDRPPLHQDQHPMNSNTAWTCGWGQHDFVDAVAQEAAQLWDAPRSSIHPKPVG